MNNFINGFINSFKREARRISKDVNIITIILLAPILYVFLYGTFYINKTEENVKIVVVDYDHSEASREFIRKLDAHKSIEVAYIVPDFNEAQDLINKWKTFGVVYIDKDFGKKLDKFEQTKIKVSLNTSRFMVSNDINLAVNDVVIDMTSALRLKYYERLGYSFEQANELIEPFKAELRSLYNTSDTYGDFILPGILILILQQTLMIGLSESIAKEREENTIDEWYRASNSSIFVTMWGKSLFYYFNYIAYSALFFSAFFGMLKLHINGSIIALIILTLLFILSVIYITIFLSSFFKRKIIAVQTIAFTTYPIFFTSGYSWPSFTMPVYLQWFAQILPSSPYLDAMSRIVNKGATLADVKFQILHIAILAFISLIATRIRLKFLISSAIGKKISFLFASEK